MGAAAPTADGELLEATRRRVNEVSEALGHRPRILVGKPGLDGHSNGAEQIAVRARDVGMEVIYQGIRLTPEQIAASAADEDVDVVGLSILSGSHRELIPETVRLHRRAGARRSRGGRRDHPAADEAELEDAGVARVYTPKDFDVKPDHRRDRRDRGDPQRDRRPGRLTRLSQTPRITVRAAP